MSRNTYCKSFLVKLSLSIMCLIPLLSIGAYLLGSIPWGSIISKRKGVDIRGIGSGNIGATNVARALGFKWAALTFCLDTLKGFLAPLLTYLILKEYGYLIYLNSLLCILGHQFSIFERFKGGKGVATSFGVFLLIDPVSASLSLVVFIITFLMVKIVSLGSILASLSLPLWVLFLNRDRDEFLFAVLTAILIIISHLSLIHI